MSLSIWILYDFMPPLYRTYIRVLCEKLAFGIIAPFFSQYIPPLKVQNDTAITVSF